MGNNNYKLSKTHYLYYFEYNENKLYIFDCYKESFHIIPMLKDIYPFFPGLWNSISIEELGLIYFIGGKFYNQTPIYSYDVDVNNDNDSEGSFYSKNKVKDILNENKDNLFAKANINFDELNITNIVGILDVNNLKANHFLLNYECIPKLPINIYNHTLILNNKIIYIIGGILSNNETNHKCFKLDCKNNTIESFSSINKNYTLENCSGIFSKNNIYIFDLKSEVQTIHKYNLEYDLWELIILKTQDFSIPYTINPSIYQFDVNTILLLNGKSENEEKLIDYYLFDWSKEEFNLLRTDRLIADLPKNSYNQGNKNYQCSLKLFASMNSKHAYYFDKFNLWWNKIELNDYIK